MARYTYLNDYSVRDTTTGKNNWAINLPVHYVHLRNNQLIAEHNGDVLMFTPESRLADLRDDGEEQSRRVVVERRLLEDGRPYLVVVAIQAAEDSKDYVDCIVEQGS